VGVARRRCALEAVEKVVTAQRDLFDQPFGGAEVMDTLFSRRDTDGYVS
jgi:hypothetical protein